MFDRTMQVSGPVDLEVRTGSGTISIRTGADNVVRVIGHIRAFGLFWSDIDPAEQVRRLEANPPVEQRGDLIRIGSPADPSVHGVAISYELTVPADPGKERLGRSGDWSSPGTGGCEVRLRQRANRPRRRPRAGHDRIGPNRGARRRCGARSARGQRVDLRGGARWTPPCEDRE